MRKTLIVIGAILVMLVVAVLAAPALIDWSRYKDEIVARLEQATGREVTIDGDVGLRLLPSPAFTAEGLTIGNPPQAAERPFARVAQLAIRLDLLPLLSGEVAVDSLRLDQPVVHLARLPDGSGNWTFTPPADPSASAPANGAGTPAEPGDQPAFSVGEVVIRGGLVTWSGGDGEPVRLEDIDARIEGGSAAGPFAATGGLAVNGTGIRFEGAQDRVAEGRGSQARLRLTVPAAESRLSFNGMLSHLSAGPSLRGTLTLNAARPETLSRLAGGPADLPLPAGAGIALEGTLTADANEAALSDLVATIGDTRATGLVAAGFGGTPRLDIKLSAASVDLDKWLAAAPGGSTPPAAPASTPPPPAAPPLPGAGPAPAPQPFTLPQDLFADVELAVEALSYNDAVIQQARLHATLEGGEMVVHGATAQLPGGSVVSLSGALAPAAGRPVFEGQMEARSDNLRSLLNWAGLDVAAVPADRLRRLEASAAVRAAYPEMELLDLRAQLDATRARGGLTVRLAERPAYGLRLNVDSLNLDAYLPARAAPAQPQPAPAQAPAPAAPAQPAAAKPAAAPPLAVLTGFDADLRLGIDRLTMNGVPADNLRVDAVLDGGTLAIREAAAMLAGTRARAEGRVSGLAQPAPKVEDLAVTVSSPQPGRLFQFLGIDPPMDPARLGGVEAGARLSGDWQNIALDARLEAAGLNASDTGTLSSPLAQPTYRLALEARHPSFTQLVRLFDPGYRPAGTVGAVALTGTLAGGPQAVTLSDLALNAGPARLTGQAEIALGGSRPAVTARLSGNAITLDPFLPAQRTGFLLPVPGGLRNAPTGLPGPAPAILPAATTATGAPWSREPLELGALQAFDARIQLRTESLVWQEWRLDSPQALVVVDQGTAALESLTGKLLGGAMTATARLSAGPDPALSGTLAIAGAGLSQARLGAGGITVSQGRLDAEARFTTSGRSSHDMAQHLDGNGALTVVDGVVSGFDLPAVNRRLQNIENIGSLLGLLQAGLSGGNTRFSRLAATFVAKNGVVTTRDLKLDAEGGGATGEAVVRLPPWTMQAAIAFSLADTQAPPAVVRLEGPIGNPRKIIDVNAIQQHLVARGLGRALKGKEAGKLLENLLGGGQRQAAPEQQSTDQPARPQQPPATPQDVLRGLLQGLGR